MATKAERAARARLQARVSKVVWGVLFIAAGLLLTLEDQGKIVLGLPSKYQARNAVDGNPKTRWSSAFQEAARITIDLGAPAEITRVRLSWEKAYATAYRVQVSSDGSDWTTVKEVKDGHGGIEEFDVTASGRYVRLEGTKRSTPWGYSLFELEVYGTTEAGGATSSVSLLSSGKPATASSVENATFGYWLLYWPVLLVAGGLPLLLVPKDAGEQVIGLLMAGIGVFLQLQKLGRIPWSLGQAWPILLVLAGLLLVTQALAQRNRPSDDGPPTGGGAGLGGCAS